MSLEKPITHEERKALAKDIDEVGAVNVTHLSVRDRLWAQSYANAYAHPASGRVNKRTDELTGETELITEYEEMYRDYLIALGMVESVKDQIPDGDYVINLMRQLWNRAYFGPPPKPFI